MIILDSQAIMIITLEKPRSSDFTKQTAIEVRKAMKPRQRGSQTQQDVVSAIFVTKMIQKKTTARVIHARMTVFAPLKKSKNAIISSIQPFFTKLSQNREKVNMMKLATTILQMVRKSLIQNITESKDYLKRKRFSGPYLLYSLDLDRVYFLVGFIFSSMVDLKWERADWIQRLSSPSASIKDLKFQ